MHYFLIYKKISEILFQISNVSYSFFPHLLIDHSSVPMMREIGSTMLL